MKFIKKNYGSILFISAIFITNILLWFIRMKADFYNNSAILVSISGSTLLMGFLIVFLLSTRMKWLVHIFGGLENVYFWHRLLAISTTAAIFVHGLISEDIAIFNNVNIPIIGSASGAGELSRNLFLFLVAAALLAKFFKYEHFRFIHRFLVIPYLIGLYHGFFTSWIDLFAFNTLSIWMIITSVIGLGSSLYMLLIYQTSSFNNTGIVIDKKLLNDNIIELKVLMEKEYKFKSGQFAFIKIRAHKISKASHPFSISGQNGKYIYFTIKTLGDFTDSLVSSLTTPTRINITNPYGSMTFNSKTNAQLWVAGGIGVTPFLGYLRSENQLNKAIHLIYSVRNETEAVHLDTLNELSKQNKNFKFTLFDSSKQGYLSSSHLGLTDDVTLYMCGPRPMVQSLKKQVTKQHPNVIIFYEAFSFTGTLVDDILKFLKRYIRILKPKH